MNTIVISGTVQGAAKAGTTRGGSAMASFYVKASDGTADDVFRVALFGITAERFLRSVHAGEHIIVRGRLSRRIKGGETESYMISASEFERVGAADATELV